MGKVIATDLDGTLFYPKRRVRMIKSKSLKFLRRHIDNGGRLVLVSGRNIDSAKMVKDKINRPLDAIGCNGSVITINGEIIHDVHFDPEKTLKALDEIEKEFKIRGFYIMNDDCEFIMRNRYKEPLFMTIYRVWNFFQGVYATKFIVDKEKYFDGIKNCHARKIMMFFGINKKDKNRSKEVNKIIRERYPDVFEASWANEFIELSPAGCSKSQGLKYYLNYLNIKPSDVYVVGDSGNDISMFNEFPEKSFCMSHAPLSVSKYAKHVVKHFSDVEKFINK